MEKKERAVGLTMTVLVSAAMGAVASYLVLKTNPQAAVAVSAPVMYGSNIVLSVILGLVISLVIPLGKLGRVLAKKANANPPGIGFTLLNALPFAVGNTALISLALSFLGVFMARSHIPAEALARMPPLPVMWLGSWVQLLLPTLVASYAVSVILSPVVSSIAGLGKPSESGE